MKFLPSTLALAAGLLLAATPAARAQDYETQMMENSTELYNNNIQAITNGIINKDMMDKTVARYNARSGAAATKTTAATRTRFAYVPTAALQKHTADAYVAQIRATNPAAAATVATGLAGKTNYPALYRELNNGTGLRENDAADVMTAYLIENWAIANGITDGKAITPAKIQGVRAQTARVLAGNAKLQAPAALAQFGEQLKLNTAMLEVGRLRSQHDGTGAAYRQKVAAQFQRQFHFDMSQLQLTTQGLVKK